MPCSPLSVATASAAVTSWMLRLRHLGRREHAGPEASTSCLKPHVARADGGVQDAHDLVEAARALDADVHRRAERRGCLLQVRPGDRRLLGGERERVERVFAADAQRLQVIEALASDIGPWPIDSPDAASWSTAVFMFASSWVLAPASVRIRSISWLKLVDILTASRPMPTAAAPIAKIPLPASAIPADASPHADHLARGLRASRRPGHASAPPPPSRRAASRGIPRPPQSASGRLQLSAGQRSETNAPARPDNATARSHAITRLSPE